MNTHTVKGIFLVLAAILVTYSSKAADTLTIKSSELQFTTNYEKDLFENVNDIGINYLHLALAIDTNTNENFRNEADKKLDEVIAEIKGKMNPKKGLDKNIKVIYDAVHQNLLKKYELVVPFQRIFIDGTYNCVTATILYALVLDKLNITYTIKETSNHVFIIADPANEHVYIETTDPIKGYYTISNEAKQAIIKMLVDGKLISKEERATKSDQQLIDSYFNQDKEISITKAIGLQYYNQGIRHGDALEYEKAVESYKKSYFLYPDIKTIALINTVLFSTFYNSSTSDNTYPENFKLFVLLNNNKAMELKHDLFTKIANDYSEKKDDLPKLTAYLNSLLEMNIDSSTKDNLKQVYYTTAMTNHYLKKDFINVFRDLEQLLILEPKNIRYKAVLDETVKAATGFGGYSLLYGYADDNDNESLSREKLFEHMDSLTNIFERLSAYTDNPKVKLIHFMVYSKKVAYALEHDQLADMENLINNVEQEYSTLKQYSKQLENTIYPVYTDASGYFYKRRNYKMAKSWLLRGLKLFPNNEVLKGQYDQIKSY